MLDEIDRLRQVRGDERVTFADVADHLYDFTERNVEVTQTIQRLAAFLVSVEATPHRHPNRLPGSTVSGGAA